MGTIYPTLRRWSYCKLVRLGVVKNFISLGLTIIAHMLCILATLNVT